MGRNNNNNNAKRNNKAGNNRAGNNRAGNNRAGNNRVGNNARNNSNQNGLGGAEILIIVLVLMTLVGIYFYIQQNKTRDQENFETTQLTPDTDKELTACLFYAEWCGHCKSFKPEWEKAKAQLDSTRINGVKINIVSIDCDKEEDLAKQYDISGFPTVKCIKKDDVIEYNDERNADAVIKFVRQQANDM
jgi:protein disulfide-isomerase-like protein